MTEAIEVEGLSFRYRGFPVWALRDVHLRVAEGEVTLVTGPTGSGKSTLLRALNGLLPDFYEGEVRGTVRVFGQDVLSLRPNRVATFVGTVFQSPEDQIIAAKVRRDVAFGLENLGLAKEAIRERVGEALAAVGLEGSGDREVSALSGGQMQRLALAGILAMRPRVLLLDEPASELDPRGRREILRVIEGLVKKGRRTMILADHRLGDLLGLMDRVVVMDRGQIAFDGPPQEVMTRPELEDLGVEIPTPVRIWRHLTRLGFPLPCPLTSGELVDGLVPKGRTLSDALEAAA
ncbi:MAG: energy-coupling factor ABC transporter ATP-binding protein [Thermoplasmata archaeon]